MTSSQIQTTMEDKIFLRIKKQNKKILWIQNAAISFGRPTYYHVSRILKFNF